MDCKSCEWFNLTENQCLRDKSKCYDSGKALKTECEFYKLGDWGDE